MDKRNWDDISSKYDQSVEDNKDPVIADYLQNEMEIVGRLCQTVLERNKNQCSIVDVGSGTGRVIFSLAARFPDPSVRFCGIEVSEEMIKLADAKKLARFPKNRNMDFFAKDSTDPKVCDLIGQGTSNVVMCLYNTLGVIHPDKRTVLIENMYRMAGPNGLVILSAFNGDDFAFVAPKMYVPMKAMVRQIDSDSFDEKNRVFKNTLGFRSQWFRKDELTKLLGTDTISFPINVQTGDKSHTLGNIFASRTVK